VTGFCDACNDETSVLMVRELLVSGIAPADVDMTLKDNWLRRCKLDLRMRKGPLAGLYFNSVNVCAPQQEGIPH
jgi:hypothetical protein